MSTLGKGFGILGRVGGLVRTVAPFGAEIAVSHNSYAQALTAAVLRIPVVTAMDYEHQPANHLHFRLAQRVLVPEPFPDPALRKFGAPTKGVVRYPGIKEEVYLADFRPDPDFRERMGIPADRTLVTMRPPARSALYHRFDNPLFDAAVELMASSPNTQVVLLDRAESDWAQHPNVIVPRQALDGPNLIYWSDLVVGAGGTMNREAAVLGTPVYSLYAGKPSAVDDYLVERGRMTRVTTLHGVQAIPVRKKAHTSVLANAAGLHCILDVIASYAVKPATSGAYAASYSLTTLAEAAEVD
jgi:predicted glycosyltransferase